MLVCLDLTSIQFVNTSLTEVVLTVANPHWPLHVVKVDCALLTFSVVFDDDHDAQRTLLSLVFAAARSFRLRTLDYACCWSAAAHLDEAASRCVFLSALMRFARTEQTVASSEDGTFQSD